MVHVRGDVLRRPHCSDCEIINGFPREQLNIHKKEGGSGPKVMKNFMLNSTEHEILNAHEYKNSKKFTIFTQISLYCYFSCS